MTPKWLQGLMKARQFQEDAARAELAAAQRESRRAHHRVKTSEDHLNTLRYAGSNASVTSFVAASVALQAAAGAVAAASEAAAHADQAADHRRSDLTNAAVKRRGAEELAQRAHLAEKARLAAAAQRSQDEIAAAVFRRNSAADTPAHEGGEEQ